MSLDNHTVIILFLVLFVGLSECSSNGYNRRQLKRNQGQPTFNAKSGNIDRANARIKKRQDYEVIDATATDDQAAQFDLASFIQNSQDNEANVYKYSERNRNYNDYDSMIDANLLEADNLNNNMNMDKEDNIDNSDFNKKNPTYNPKYFDYTQKSTDDIILKKVSRAAVANETNQSNKFKSIVKNKIKKCSIKEMKFPFFFHNNTRKSKTANKRSFFHRKNNTLKTSTKPTVKPELNTLKPGRAKEDPDSFYRISKRSFRDYLCPMCIKRLNKMNNSSKPSETTKKHKIHNSRQFYQQVEAQKGLVESNEYTPNQQEYEKLYTDHKELTADRKIKREDNNLKAKQEKELDEIQKNVEELDIAPPKPKNQDETLNTII